MSGFNPLIFNTSQLAAYQALQNQMQKEGGAGNAGNNFQNIQNSAEQNLLNLMLTPNAGQASQTFAGKQILQNPTVLNAQTPDLKALSTVEIEQRANYIKELLNLPKDFSDLIRQIQTENPDMQAMKELSKLLVNGKINLTALTALLGENSKNAIQKLMMTIMSVSKMGANVSELKELVGMISKGGTTDNIQAVKNLLMLYLPYLPMSVRSELNLNFNIDIFDKIQGPDPDINESGETIKILIQTANYGNVLATLDLAPNYEIDIFIQAVENFPEKEVIKLFNEQNGKNSVRTNMSVEKNQNFTNIEEIRQNLEIVSSDYVSPKLLFACHTLIKVIIDVDSKEFIINEEDV